MMKVCELLAAGAADDEGGGGGGVDLGVSVANVLRRGATVCRRTAGRAAAWVY